MKKTKLLAAGLLAAAAVAVLAPSARAANSYNTGDLFLGFEDPGNSNDYVVDLGPASYFIGLAASPGTTNITTSDYSGAGLGNIASDLQTIFGTNWYANSNTPGDNLQWGVVGATAHQFGSNLTFGLPGNTLFLTQGELTPGTLSSAPAKETSGVQGTVNSNILGFENAFSGSAQTANSNYAEEQTIDPINNPDSWSGENPGSGAFGLSYGIEQPTSGSNIGPTDSVLDLYEIQPGSSGSGTDLGSLSLTSGGALEFTSAAVPEPSTYAALGIGTALLLLFRRNRKPIHS